jgi:biotin carboxyl carrier protein
MRYVATVEGVEHQIEVEEVSKELYRLRFDGHEFAADLRRVGATSFSVIVDSRCFDLEVVRDGGEVIVASREGRARIAISDGLARPGRRAVSPRQAGKAEVKAMMPGKVVAVLVSPGDEVAAGQGVVTVEAMKMENELKSPTSGKVAEVRVSAGTNVEKGNVLVIIE